MNLTDSQQRDAATYEPGQVIEFHRMAKGVVRDGIKEKRFKSGEQWQVLRRENEAVIIGRSGIEKALPLEQATRFSVFERETFNVAAGDLVRFTKNLRHRGQRFLNNELRKVVSVDNDKVTFDRGAELHLGGAGLHIDQGIAITSHASQGKTVDEVIVSVPVRSFSQANEAQFYVSMSRARYVMHLFTDSKVALREAVMRPSKRLSFFEMLQGVQRENALRAELQKQCENEQAKEQHKGRET
ncbi:MAG: hypothetical protein JOZ60_14145 [Verrucomicrobia bacterium]|nr:hypothetical protein [Verrucomicrobiota bacterium]